MMPSPDDSLNPAVQTVITIASIFFAQLISRLWGNFQVRLSAKTVIDNTPSPGQVTSVDNKVVEIQAELKKTREELAEFKAQVAVNIGKVLEREDSQDSKMGSLKKNSERLLTRAGIAWEDEVTTIKGDKV